MNLELHSRYVLVIFDAKIYESVTFPLHFCLLGPDQVIVILHFWLRLVSLLHLALLHLALSAMPNVILSNVIRSDYFMSLE